MTLKEKFEVELVFSFTKELHNEKCEKIADEFAIGFLKWYVQEYSENEIEYLLEEYKKEKGL
jgi:hypothetical protein